MNDIQTYTKGLETNRKLLMALAWGAILLVSAPTIILRLLVQDLPAEPLTPYWLAGLIVAVLAVMWGATWIFSPTKPLRGFFLALVAFSIGFFFGIPLLYGNAAIINWAEGTSWGWQLVVAQVYSGDPIPGGNFADPSIFDDARMIDGIGDLAYATDLLGTDYAFVDGDVAGFLGYSDVNMGDVDAPKRHTAEETEALFRLFHERVTG